MDIDTWIEEVHRNKHNMLPVVKMAVLKPIYAMLEPECRTKDFPSSLLTEIEAKKPVVDEIMEYLSSIGDIELGDENPADILHKQVRCVIDTIIPQIKSFSSFYSQFKDKEYYFTETDEGKRALGLLIKAPLRCEMACEGLSKLERANENVNKENNEQVIRICEIVENIFDELDNINVIYKFQNRNITIRLERNDFESKVLMNIIENIKRHAFPFEEYKDKLVVDKIVEVFLTSNSDGIILRISNNGAPFQGNVENLFKQGYHAGKYGRTGFGLASAKQYMLGIGGNIEFSYTENYNTSFVITIPNKR